MKKAKNKNLVIIPARGGSKGIPRKNLRPLSGYPLIYYSITAALNAKTVTRVVVSTEDDEIALFSKRFGADVILRNVELADDKTTLDPVIKSAVNQCEQEYKECYEYVVTVQATSPLITPKDIDEAIYKISQGGFDTVLSVVDDRHLCWTIDNDKAIPTYNARVNRQELPSNFRETGAVIACCRKQLETGTRIGENVGIYEVPFEHSFDIDTYADLYVCEAMLSRKKIVITVVGYAEVGLGHAYRGIMLAHELVQYDLVFICEDDSDLAIEYIRSNNYPLIVAEKGKLAEFVITESPDLVINDILDTSEAYMKKLIEKNIRIVNFEDLGSGNKFANLIINALYPHQVPQENILVGPEFFCLRDEFLYANFSRKEFRRNDVKQVLVTFGGVDESDLTSKVVNEIVPFCILEKIKIEVIIGPGYRYEESLINLLESFSNLKFSLITNTRRISEHMAVADLAITSAGRTVLELASLIVPMIVICQNDREVSHTFASKENGVVNLGHRDQLKEGDIIDSFKSLIVNYEYRELMAKKMKELKLDAGKARVISKIKSLIR